MQDFGAMNIYARGDFYLGFIYFQVQPYPAIREVHADGFFTVTTFFDHDHVFCPNVSRRTSLAPSPIAPRECICEDMCVFEIRFAEGVEEDLRNIRIYYRNQILDAIEEQLAREPETRTKNRKLLENLIPPWQMVAPIWELRVGEYRVFYDVSATESVVYVRAVRRKRRGTKTEDIL